MRFRTIVASVLGIEPGEVHDELSPADVIGWDSLVQLELILALEAEYNVRFSQEDVLQIFTLGDIQRLLLAKGVNSK